MAKKKLTLSEIISATSTLSEQDLASLLIAVKDAKRRMLDKEKNAGPANAQDRRERKRQESLTQEIIRNSRDEIRRATIEALGPGPWYLCVHPKSSLFEKKIEIKRSPSGGPIVEYSLQKQGRRKFETCSIGARYNKIRPKILSLCSLIDSRFVKFEDSFTDSGS